MTHDPAELRTLADAALDGRLSAEQLARLEQIVLSDPMAARWYADYAHLDAAVRQSAADPATFAARPTPAAPTRRRSWAAALGGAGIAAAVLVGGYAVFRPDPPKPLTVAPAAVATLTETKACLWEAGSLPTEAGADLPPGRLRLAAGLARVRFASGAVLTVEGPADLEVVSAMRCVLHRGQVTASVPPPAIGFVLDTPQSRVTDFGTEFGVTVRDGSAADVFVFTGRVDVLHHPTGRIDPLKTGARRRYAADGVFPLDPQTDMTADPPPVPKADGREVRLTTAGGRGRDAFVMPIPIPDNRRSDTLLLVKRARDGQSDWHRKAYFAIDLEETDPNEVTAAELTLTFAPTGMGYAAQVPDATFAVYGLTDEAHDGWTEAGLRWANAPANRPGGDRLDPAGAVRVGGFVIPQGEQACTRTVGGPELVAFLKRDTNRLVTFVVVRETTETGGSGLVHGFASRRHPTLPPPTLRLSVGR